MAGLRGQVAVRPAQPGDAPALVELRAVVHPYLVRSPAATARLLAQPAPGEDRLDLVAMVDGSIVGTATARRNTSSSEAGVGALALHVHPGHRRRGIGTTLLEAAGHHLATIGVRRVQVIVAPGAEPFARHHGYTPQRTAHFSALDLRPDRPRPAVPEGVVLAPLHQLDDEALYRAHVVAASDEPGPVPADALSFETWRHTIRDDPDLDEHLSTVALAGGRIVAFTLVSRDRHRIWSDMTATVPQRRGRGLALLVKGLALSRAATGGAAVAYTANDETNAPMLAVNRRLGYRTVASELVCLGSIDPPMGGAVPGDGPARPVGG